MKIGKLLLIILLVAAGMLPSDAASSFESGKGTFLLDGEPYVVKAAELHYPRIPRQYWDQRIKMCKALGMNTVCMYVFWNTHESAPDNFDFSGQNDIREFVKLCQANGMNVILRPGPYVCAEWEMGGLPWWLLKKKDIRLREQDPYFMERVDRFQQKVAEQLGDLTVENGGPIIMIQVENEYGSYGKDKPYVSAIRDILRKYYGDKTTLFQCDWSSNFLDNGLDDLVWTMNFGTGADIDQQFAGLRKVRPDSPLMCSEFWSGWFDKWGANHETRPAEDMVSGIGEMLSKGISFSLYMTHGGTNWGHWAGANSPGYAPDVTSYDYDAPIDEAGQPTHKFWLLRDTLAKYNGGVAPAPMPELIKAGTVPEFSFDEVAPLFTNLPEGKRSDTIKTMEEYDQGFGSILYRTTLPALPDGGVLTVNDAHDYAQIFVDDLYVGSLDRRNAEKQLRLPACKKGARLDILVDAMGRINFGRAIKDYKGITDNVTITMPDKGKEVTEELHDWEVFNLEDKMEFYDSMEYYPVGAFTAGADGRLPRGVYRGTFNVDTPTDTFLDFESWGRGYVYVNGHALGRIWEIGPQQTLYMPGCWLKEGENEILVYDVIGPRMARSQGLSLPVLDKLQGVADASDSGIRDIDLTDAKAVLESSFREGNGWQEARFDKPVKGRYVCIEVLNTTDGGDVASVAEWYLLDERGERISREPWSVNHVDSEQRSNDNHTADKIFDLQESTYWSTASGKEFPQKLVLDLGKMETVGGLQYLPRMETGAPQGIKEYKIYVSENPF